MNGLLHPRCTLATLSILLTACAQGTDPAPDTERPDATITPLTRAHAHNDYAHDRPLVDALDQGFTSVEADVFLVGDALLVGHTFVELRPWNTLEALYLEPLAERVRANGGRVFANGPTFLLWIDIKNRSVESFRALQIRLQRHASMLAQHVEGQEVPGAVQVILTGKRPFPEVRDSEPRLAKVDAGIGTLGRGVPAEVAPFVSASWTSRFAWRGAGPMPAAERERLRALVARIHAEGKRLRFWATPESERLWAELHDAGVDLLNTDELQRLATFLRARDTH